MLKFILMIIMVILILFIFYNIAIIFESKDYNKGKCVKCGSELKYFDTDSQGGRGYKCCGDCGYTTWVSYNRIDRDCK